MSYGVYIVDKEGHVLHDHSPRVSLGGTYNVNSCLAEFNITYNYSGIIAAALQKDSGLRSLDGQLCMNTINDLVNAILVLDQNVHEDYWVATEGNVRIALVQLLNMAVNNPFGYWNIE